MALKVAKIEPELTRADELKPGDSGQVATATQTNLLGLTLMVMNLGSKVGYCVFGLNRIFSIEQMNQWDVFVEKMDFQLRRVK